MGACLLGLTQANAGEDRFKEGEVIVKLRAPLNSQGRPLALSSKATSQAVSKLSLNLNLKLQTSFSGINVQHMSIESGKSVSETVNSLNAMSEVEYAEPNWIVDKLDFQDGPVQSYSLSELGGVEGTFEGTFDTFAHTSAHIQGAQTWSYLTSGSTQTVVAIIDTGVSLSHPSFTGAIWSNSREIAGNGVDDDGNGYIDDVNGWNFVSKNNNPNDDEGHGTHVAGVVLGTSENIFASPASSPYIKLMPLKFLDSAGSGSTADAIKAIYYAVNNGARVLNNSWGGGKYSLSLHEAIAYTYALDAIFVAAAGNSHGNNDSKPTYPASYDVPNVVSVAATDDVDTLAYFSNFGSGSVSLGSPGVSILSTYLNGNYAYLSGTSMAAPFVSGVTALMRYKSPVMNCYQVKQILEQQTDKVSSLAPYTVTSGRVNNLNSVSTAATTALNSFKPEYVLGASTQNSGLSRSIAARGGCGTIENMIPGRERKFYDKDGKMNITEVLGLIGLLAIPVVAILYLRRKSADPASRRRFERFNINSSVSFSLGGQQLSGSINSISVGGSDLNTEALLKEGSVISMMISSPDGKSQIEVKGHVVWSVEKQKYGIEFLNAGDTIKSEITDWSKGLNKAS